MAMAAMQGKQPEPEPETLTLGYVEIVFDHPQLQEFDPGHAELISTEISVHINQRLQDIVSSRFNFSMSGYDVTLSALTLEFETAYEGSIVGRFKMIGAALIASYGAVASYPAFRDAIPVLIKDIDKAIHYVMENVPKPVENVPEPTRHDIYFRDEQEILSDIIAKKAPGARKEQDSTEVARVLMRPNIDPHDYEVKMKSVRRYLCGGHNVKILMRFRGRELENRELGTELFNRVIEDVRDISRVEANPELDGRNLTMVLAPK